MVDATDQVLGRLATRIAQVLSGKHRPSYIPYLDTGDFVIVTNAGRIRLSGNKLAEKAYRHHTGYPGVSSRCKPRTSRRSIRSG